MDYSRIKSNEEVRKYIENLKKDNSPEAIQRIRQSLIDAGILNKDGTRKEHICNGGYYGW